MEFFQIILVLATFLCSLVAGFLFAFAVVVMPGIGRLQDCEFIRSFQRMDRIIQQNQPLFMLVWVGSIISLVISAVLGFGQLAGAERLLLISASLAYLVGVQLPTGLIHIPLNNHLQTLDVEVMTEAAQQKARHDFEPRWNRWNVIRSIFASLASVSLMVLLLRL